MHLIPTVEVLRSCKLFWVLHPGNQQSAQVNMPPKRKLNVFVSSTSEDLLPIRAAARLVILDMEWMPIMMEHVEAMTAPTVQACKVKLAAAELVLLIVGYRRGWVPSVEQGGNGVDSVTALELAFARSRNIPVLAMMANPKTWPGSLYEDDGNARNWIKNFRDGLNLSAKFFDYEQESAGGVGAESLPIFRSKVRETLVAYREELGKQEVTFGAVDSGIDYFDSASEALTEGDTIPFLGTGVYNNLLSDSALIKGLSGDPESARAANPQDSKDRACLATVAEYRERYLKERQRFLDKLGTVIQAQTNQLTALPPFYQLLLKVKPPALIVSATCDLVFERALEKLGKSYALVCHVVRSRNKEQDGKILVFRGQQPEFCVADKIETKGSEYVIYKPLGSPLLHSLVDPDLEIDTVVMTETDHLILLGRLEHELTQIPTVFSRVLQRRSLLFAGYALDVWQYRLVMQVFELLRAQGGRPTSMAVREPTATMEALSWTRLGTDLIRMPLDEFACRVLKDLAQGAEVSAYGN